MENRKSSAVQNTDAALQLSEGKTIKTWHYADDGSGIGLYFTDGTSLHFDIMYEREIEGVQSNPQLIAHFKKK
jgi:hypothetical protein